MATDNKQPVGSAAKAIRKEVPEGRANAIQRRMAAKKKAMNKGGLPKPSGKGY